MLQSDNALQIKERNYGIDLLRIISMFMVTLQHFCRQGGLVGTPEDGLSFYILTAFVVICYGAVDIFALISGYVMRRSKVKYQNLAGLYRIFNSRYQSYSSLTFSCSYKTVLVFFGIFLHVLLYPLL